MSGKDSKWKNLADVSPNELIQRADREAQNLRKLKTHQLRNVFSAVSAMRTTYKQKKTYESIEMDLVMLKPKLAYAAGRQREVRSSFYPFMVEVIDAVETAGKEGTDEEKEKEKEKAIQNFFALMESVIAYHKFYEN